MAWWLSPVPRSPTWVFPAVSDFAFMSSFFRIGIKRSVHRAQDASAALADAAFEPMRQAALVRANYKCVRCGLESGANPATKKRSALQVHHVDNDHHNNDAENFQAHCDLDHAIHHIGCDAPSTGGNTGWATQMRIAHIPQLSIEDANLLQRAIGAALAEPQLKASALEMISLLGTFTLPVRDVCGSCFAKDFAAAMADMTAAEYENRQVGGLTVLFHPDILKQAGAQMVADHPLYTPKTWINNGIR